MTTHQQIIHNLKGRVRHVSATVAIAGIADTKHALATLIQLVRDNIVLTSTQRCGNVDYTYYRYNSQPSPTLRIVQ